MSSPECRRTMRRRWRQYWQKGPDGRLLSQVSELSGSIWHSYLRIMSSFRKSKTFRAWLFALAAAVLAAGGGAPAGARDHDEARRAVEAGEIRPLAEILSAVRDKLPGQVVGVKLEHEHSRWMYEFRVIDAKGRLFEVYVDARGGGIERTKEK